MEWRMLAITWRCNKADIRQIVGRDRVSRRNSATSFGALLGAREP